MLLVLQTLPAPAVLPPPSAPGASSNNGSLVLQPGTSIAGQGKDAHGQILDIKLTLTDQDTRKFLLDRADLENLAIARHDLVNCQADLDAATKTKDAAKPTLLSTLGWPMVAVVSAAMFVGGVWIGARVVR
jgi:hypothetical protein